MALDVNEASAQEIIDQADSLSDAEKAELATAERAGKNRKTVLAALEGKGGGGGEGEGEGRRSGTGRLLEPQEADPRDAVEANVGEQIVKQHEALAHSEASPESTHADPLVPGNNIDAAEGGGDATGGSTPAGTGAAPAATTGAVAAV